MMAERWSTTMEHMAGNVMNLPRRRFLKLAAGAAALPVFSDVARAQAYPTRPVRWVVPYAPGSGADIVVRLLGQWLSERFGQPLILDNRPGGASNIGTEAVVRASPDGHSLLLVTTNNATNATLYDKLSFNFIRDIAPVASIMRVPNVMVVHPSVPAKTVGEFIAYAKVNPDKIIMASGGNGTPAHVCGELFKMMAGVNMVHVPYRGAAPALTDLLGGQVQVTFSPLPASIGYIRAGTLRALAVTSATRVEALPDIPTVGDFVPDFEASGWLGVGAPRNTPAEIVDKLNREINAGLADPKIKARLADLGGTPFPGSPADFGKLIVEETEKWAKVIRFAGIKPE
jgi:tripartite-type tricarboxylate transporter receptor subunit TctC